VPGLTIEEHHSTAQTPPAHTVNQRMVEIVRALRISKAFHEVATPPSMMSNNSRRTTSADPEVARSQAWGSRQIDSPTTSWPAVNLWATAH
jgi:2,4-dichlorophenol 6-monooxygenase